MASLHLARDIGDCTLPLGTRWVNPLRAGGSASVTKPLTARARPDSASIPLPARTRAIAIATSQPRAKASPELLALSMGTKVAPRSAIGAAPAKSAGPARMPPPPARAEQRSAVPTLPACDVVDFVELDCEEVLEEQTVDTGRSPRAMSIADITLSHVPAAKHEPAASAACFESPPFPASSRPEAPLLVEGSGLEEIEAEIERLSRERSTRTKRWLGYAVIAAVIGLLGCEVAQSARAPGDTPPKPHIEASR